MAAEGDMALTRRQKQLYDFVSEFVERNGYSPSYQEIGDGMGLSSLATVHKHISNLENKGLLKRGANRSRSIDLLRPKGRMKLAFPMASAPTLGFSLPFAGRIVAGRPLESVETSGERISLTDFTRSKDVFVLQVSGDSMQDEHIVDGDYVLVERANVARDGEIVVALVDGVETTLKRIYVEGEDVRLQPSNANIQPIVVPADSVRVQGRVIGVLRKY
jgi:repressor LexA